MQPGRNRLAYPAVWLALVGCIDLGEPVRSAPPEPAAPPEVTAPSKSARALVEAWRQAALDLDEGGTEPLLRLVRTPFDFEGVERVRSFRADTPDELREAFAVTDRQAVVHTAALLARASGADAEPKYETPRRGEIRAVLGDEAGYALTLRADASGWAIVRFAPVRSDRGREGR